MHGSKPDFASGSLDRLAVNVAVENLSAACRLAVDCLALKNQKLFASLGLRQSLGLKRIGVALNAQFNDHPTLSGCQGLTPPGQSPSPQGG